MPEPIVVTAKAAQRWIDRVDARASLEDARAAIHEFEPIIVLAAVFGAPTVILGCGARLVLDGLTVVTVLERGHHASARRQPCEIGYAGQPAPRVVDGIAN